MRRATITTHEDPETEQPGETHGPHTVVYVPGKPYLMLLRADYDPTFDPIEPQAVVALADVACVDIQR